MSLPIYGIVLYFILGSCFGVLFVCSLTISITILRSTPRGLTFQKVALIMTCIQCVFRTWSGFVAPHYYDDESDYPSWLFAIHGQAPAMLFFSIYCVLIDLMSVASGPSVRTAINAVCIIY